MNRGKKRLLNKQFLLIYLLFIFHWDLRIATFKNDLKYCLFFYISTLSTKTLIEAIIYIEKGGAAYWLHQAFGAFIGEFSVFLYIPFL